MIVSCRIEDDLVFNTAVGKLGDPFFTATMGCASTWVVKSTFVCHCYHQLVEIVLVEGISRLKKNIFSTIFDLFLRCSAMEELVGWIEIWVKPIIHVVLVELDSAKIVIRISYDIMVANIIAIVGVAKINFS